MAAHEHWKFGFVGGRDETGFATCRRRVSMAGAVDHMEPAPLADVLPGRSPPSRSTTWPTRSSPPVVAVVDFDGGGRFRCELTDVDPKAVAIGDPVEMTFRRLFTRRGRAQLLLEGPPVGQLRRRLNMASNGIKDRVAIVGMGCTPFGEHWDKGTDDLLVDAARRRPQSAGVDLDDVDAYWLGTMGSGVSGLMLSRPLKLALQAGHPGREHVRHRSEAFRNAATPWPPAPTTW